MSWPTPSPSPHDASPAAILFDMDDTLVATAALWREAEAHLLRELGHEWSASLALRYKGMNALDVAATIHRLLSPAIDVAECQRIMRRALLENFASQPTNGMPGAAGCVALAAEVAPPEKLALASGSPLPAIEQAIGRLGLAGRFDVVCSSEAVLRGKPHPDVFLAAADRLSAPPHRCLVFEDSVVGAQAARAAGMVCFAVPSCQPKEIRGVAHRVFASLADVSRDDLRHALIARGARP